MVGKPHQHRHHHGSSSLGATEELNLLHMAARGSPDVDGGEVRRGALGQWKCRLLGSLLRPRRLRCVVCLQVQHVTGLPPAAEGRGVVVGWRSKGGEGEHTAPARVTRGAAAFDEVFLQYLSAGGATLRGFTVWAALLDSPAANGDLGAFPVDLAEVAAAESSNPKFGGKVFNFPLGGAAAGAVLTVSIYCRVMEHEETNGHAREKEKEKEKKNKGKGSYASCLPDLSCLRNRQVAAAASGSARRATSIRSDRGGGFITIENSVAEMDAGGAFRVGVAEDVDEEGAGFITMEKGTVSSRSRRPLPDTIGDEEAEDEKPCLFMELSEEAASVASAFEVDRVEDEFLAMLEDRYWARSKEIEKGLSVSLDIGLDLGLDLDSLIKDAEMELAKAEQAWKSKVGAAIVEEEEYKELVRRWSARETTHHSSAAAPTGCSWGFGFGSPI
ncbi:hypothetical protein HU200_040131 [Digitaria exilis]|uniref:C2 NT-type domain-containing protein n=1 Tax=Digitaria exilis TaxID=1010633 RepID=A0A835B9V6_9POAL|nr:hypothetical protein HU200_040131 [Digitaria exilis]CAB3451498.1 unnamed protein product [Digitaria exilis]